MAGLARNYRNSVEVCDFYNWFLCLFTCVFCDLMNLIQALRAEYGSGDTARQGVELLQTTLLKLSDMLQVSYKG